MFWALAGAGLPAASGGAEVIYLVSVWASQLGGVVSQALACGGYRLVVSDPSGDVSWAMAAPASIQTFSREMSPSPALAVHTRSLSSAGTNRMEIAPRTVRSFCVRDLDLARVRLA